jgi:hypothetical protein
MLSIMKLLEVVNPHKVTRLVRKRASHFLTKGDFKSHEFGMGLAKKANQLDPKRRAMREKYL